MIKELNCILIGYALLMSPIYSQSVLIDQSCAPVTSSISGNLYLTHDAEGYYTGLGQEFMPSFSTINFVDLYVLADINSQVRYAIWASIYSDTINGPLLGTSMPTYLDRNFGKGAARLTFANDIPLTPGQRYVIKPDAGGGPGGGNPDLIEFFVLDPSYSNYENGRALYGGPVENRDMWFREGLIVPEPSTFALAGLALGLGWLGWNWSKRKAS